MQHEIEGGIFTVVLDRSEKLNAFTVEMADALERTFVAVNDDDSVRAVIVTGADRAFCAGMDLSSAGNAFGLDGSKAPITGRHGRPRRARAASHP
ncbi:1,4-dihydroxy-2-naphthoyl-CoA synthase [Rhodococcus sp. T7]|nr:1,4-dihydroxy-2-naphthoyl-CoA synthase [Rhodococcus sp. T7]KAF0961499.1 1,4-dihydroxy-2-naphthoyl-CoA synthase [Rhodococcus sp. T7]